MMAESMSVVMCESDASKEDENGEGVGVEGGKDSQNGLTDAQKDILERCLHALTHAKNDSHMLAALLLITRLCPAGQLESSTLRRIFEAVGLNLPARLLVTAVRGDDSTGLPPEELLSLGTALLAALSTDPEMASHPQLLTTIPLLLGLLGNGSTWSPQKSGQMQTQSGQSSQDQNQFERRKDSETSGIDPPSQRAVAKIQSAGNSSASRDSKSSEVPSDEGVSTRVNGAAPSPQTNAATRLDEAVAADCYQVLAAVCTLTRGPDQLLSRGAVPALCQAHERNQTFSREKGLPLLCRLLSGRTRDKAWKKHPAELLSLLISVSGDFCRAGDQTRLETCAQLAQFLPPPGGVVESAELKATVGAVWGVLRPMLQAKLTPERLGQVLVLSACLLDLFGWEPVGPPKFCCLLVNRACVEVRMALEEPPGTGLSPELRQTLTACYRIMEAAMEQACNHSVFLSDAPPPSVITGLSLQQSRQVLKVLEEAFSAIIYYLQQVEPSRYGDPFVFATFRSLCSWLAEETSFLKEEVTALLPFLIGYARSHFLGEGSDQSLSDWMSEMSVGEASQGAGTWTGGDALRYLLPALCHLSAEDGPRKALLAADAPALLVDFLTRGWGSVRGGGGVGSAAGARDPGMETACSALLNFAVTEPERVRKDPCFRALESLLSEALPVLVHKPRLLVLAANCCTLGLMIGRLKSAPAGPVDASQRRFFSTALRFLRSALDSGSAPGPAEVSRSWQEWWEEAGELWRLGVQALGGCVRAQPWISTLVREEGWLTHTLTLLACCSALPDAHTQGALEEALSAMSDRCPLCKEEIRVAMQGNVKGALGDMKTLKKRLAET